MENTQYNKIADLRQSPGWIKYLEWLGWNCISTKGRINIAVRKTPLGSVAKIQRPNTFTKEDLMEIEAICKKHKTMFVKIEPGLDQNLNLLTDEGYVNSYHPLLPPTTLFIDLTKSEKKLWERITKSGKYSINRAKREGVEIEIHQAPSKEKLEELLKLTKQTAKARKFLAASVDDLKTKVDAFKGKSYLIFAKNSRGEYMVGNFYLGFGDNVWYLHGGTSNEARKGKWGYALVWQSFLHLKKEGYKILDLEGIDDDRFPNFTKTWGGFSHFKEKFGGEKIAYPIPQIKFFSPTLKFLQRFYKTLPL